MRNLVFPLFVVCMILLGCGAASTDSTINSTSVSGDANAFNPYMRDKLPNLRQLSDEGHNMLSSLGARVQSIEGEAAHRKNWREEIYPVVFGDRKAPHEILVILNFSNPDSETVWKAVEEASKSLSAQECKIAVFGKSTENYGTDLMGFAIWLAHSRPGQSMAFLDYALNRWNEVKAAQKRNGTVKNFTNEYDATVSAQELPIHYSYFSRINPPIPASQQTAVARYCYNAGSVNMYQANQICQYYGIDKLPAVIVDGKVLPRISSANIIAALK